MTGTKTRDCGRRSFRIYGIMLFMYEILKRALKNQVNKLLKVYLNNTGGRLGPAGVRQPTNGADRRGLFLRPVPNQGCKAARPLPRGHWARSTNTPDQVAIWIPRSGERVCDAAARRGTCSDPTSKPTRKDKKGRGLFPLSWCPSPSFYHHHLLLQHIRSLSRFPSLLCTLGLSLCCLSDFFFFFSLSKGPAARSFLKHRAEGV